MIYNKGGRAEGENPMDKGKRRNEWGYIERERVKIYMKGRSK